MYGWTVPTQEEDVPVKLNPGLPWQSSNLRQISSSANWTQFEGRIYWDATRWFKYDRDWCRQIYTQTVPVIFEPPCTISRWSILLYGVRTLTLQKGHKYLKSFSTWCWISTEKISWTGRMHNEEVLRIVKGKGKVHPCTGCTAHWGSRGIALLFFDHSTRRGWGVSVTPRPLFTPGRDPVPIVQGAGWVPGPVWTGAENLAPPPPGFDPGQSRP